MKKKVEYKESWYSSITDILFHPIGIFILCIIFGVLLLSMKVGIIHLKVIFFGGLLGFFVGLVVFCELTWESPKKIYRKYILIVYQISAISICIITGFLLNLTLTKWIVPLIIVGIIIGSCAKACVKLIVWFLGS